MGYSIKKSFNAIEAEMKKYCEVDSIYFNNDKFSFRACIRNIIAVRQYMKNHPNTIMHLTGTENYILPFLTKYKTIVTFHDLGFYFTQRNPFKKILLKYLFVKPLEKAYMVTCVSDKTQEEVRRYVEVKNERLIWNSISDQSIHPIEGFVFNEECPRILFVGTMKNKNLNGFIPALKGIPCVLRIVGKIDDETKKILKKNHVTYENVHDLTNEEIRQEYEECDCVAFPSLYEGFGMPLLEGQSAGKAVLTSGYPPMSSIGADSCVYVDPEDTQSMRAGVLKVISEHEKYEELGRKNVKRFSLEETARQYYEAYVSIEKDFIRKGRG